MNKTFPRACSKILRVWPLACPTYPVMNYYMMHLLQAVETCDPELLLSYSPYLLAESARERGVLETHIEDYVQSELLAATTQYMIAQKGTDRRQDDEYIRMVLKKASRDAKISAEPEGDIEALPSDAVRTVFTRARQQAGVVREARAITGNKESDAVAETLTAKRHFVYYRMKAV